MREMRKSECRMQNEDRSDTSSICILHSDFRVAPLEPRRLLSAPGTGLLATYYNNPNFTGTAVSRLDHGVAFDWRAGSPSPKNAPDPFSGRPTGALNAAF